MIYYFIGAIILLLVGIIGVIIPGIPGLPLMAIVAIVYEIITHGLSTWVFVILLIISVVSILIDHLS